MQLPTARHDELSVRSESKDCGFKTQNISCKIYTCKFNSNRAVTCGYCRYAISNNGIMFLKSNLLAKKVRCLKTVSYC